MFSQGSGGSSPLIRTKLSDFDYAFACVEGQFHARPDPLESLQQDPRATITQPHPQKLKRRIRLGCEIQEVLVLADNDTLVGGGELAKLNVRGLGKPHVEDVLAIETLFSDITSECRRQLVINQEFHEL